MAIKIANLASLRQFSTNGPISLPIFSDMPNGRILCLEPGQAWREASDGQRLTYIVLDGQAELSDGASARQLGAMTMAIVEPGTEHTLTNNRDDRFAALRIETPT